MSGNLPRGLVLLLALSACTPQTNYVREAKQTPKEYRERPEVLVQVCFPDPPKVNIIQMDHVRRYGDYGEMRSVSGGRCFQVGATTSNQYVCEKFTRARPMDLIALLYRDSEREMIFDTLDKEVHLSTWTSWEAAKTQNKHRDEIGFKLANQHKYVEKPPEPNAPKIRYRLIPHDSWNFTYENTPPKLPLKPPHFKEEIPGC
jgi:hypothetical protein